MTPPILSKLSDQDLTDIANYQRDLFLQSMANAGHFKKYTDIPAAPAQSSPVTILPSNYDGGGPGFFSASFLGSSKSGKTSGNFTAGFNGRSFVGTVGAPYIMVNTAGDIFGSASNTTHAIQRVTDADYFNWYGLDLNNPLLLRSGSGQNGFQLASRAGGSHWVIRNSVVDTPGASGLTANFGISGSNYYEDLDISFHRVFNAGQEGICYIGNTGASYDGTNYINTATVHDCFSYNSSREGGGQFEHINLLTAYKNTCILSGQTGGSGQDGLVQLHDLGPGSLVRDCIFDGAPVTGTAFTHGTTVRNCYFRQTSLTAFFIGRTDNSYFAGSSRLTGQPCLYDSCIFHVDNGGTLAKFAQVAERGCDIEFRNCIFSNNITALYDDIRVAGYTNNLIGTISNNGNTSAVLTAPTYGINYNVYSDYLHHGLCNSATYQNLRMGYRQL